MIHSFLSGFLDRKRQVRHYLAIVLSVERLSGVGVTKHPQERRLLTLRGGTFLLLYNMIEASARGAIEAIHDTILMEQVPFGHLAEGLRGEMIRRFKRKADPSVHHKMMNLPAEFVSVALSEEVSMAGNVDARYIRQLASVYGFCCETAKDRTWGGVDLLTIKNHRNILAHGQQTFEEVGRDYPTAELISLSRRSIAYMSEILGNISTYIDRRDYLDSQGVGSPSTI